MKTTSLFLLMLVAALPLMGCVTVQAPVGYARLPDPDPYLHKAVSTDHSVFGMWSVKNTDPERGDLDYWAEATKKHLTLGAGYEFREGKAFTCGLGAGRWMLFTKKVRGSSYLYILGLVVRGGTIYCMEAGGEASVFTKDIPAIKKAFETLG